jgi:hypothetical protein
MRRYKLTVLDRNVFTNLSIDYGICHLSINPNSKSLICGLELEMQDPFETMVGVTLTILIGLKTQCTDS